MCVCTGRMLHAILSTLLPDWPQGLFLAVLVGETETENDTTSPPWGIRDSGGDLATEDISETLQATRNLPAQCGNTSWKQE